VIRAIPSLAFLALFAPLSPAAAGQSRPICLVPSVLDEMARELHQRDYYAHLEPGLIDEFPGAATNTVQCAVTVWTLTYDTRRAGGAPLGRCETHTFSVQALANGFLVRYLH
jgi:hypothetical protein